MQCCTSLLNTLLHTLSRSTKHNASLSGLLYTKQKSHLLCSLSMKPHCCSRILYCILQDSDIDLKHCWSSRIKLLAVFWHSFMHHGSERCWRAVGLHLCSTRTDLWLTMSETENTWGRGGNHIRLHIHFILWFPWGALKGNANIFLIRLMAEITVPMGQIYWCSAPQQNLI